MASIADYITSTLAEFYTGTAIPNAPKHTGRLPLSGEEEKSTLPPFSLTGKEPYAVPSLTMEKIQYRHEETPLNRVFFSEANMRNLQDTIKTAVYQMSGTKAYVIDDQNETDLMLIMRSYYLQYSENNPGRVAEELEDLNNRVIAFASNRIMVEIEAHKYYKQDIMDFPPPIENPVVTQIYGTRTGELKSFF